MAEYITSIEIDLETESCADLKKTGTFNYANDPTTWPLCVAYKIDDGFTDIWLPGQEFPQDLREVIESGNFRAVAFNASFEWHIWKYVCVKKLGWPPIPFSAWTCSRARACYYGLPRALDKLCRTLNLGDDGKDKEGHKAMMRICKPNAKGVWKQKRADIEANWSYCMQDVDCEYLVGSKLPPLPAIEHRIWQVDQAINARGIPVDLDLCRGAVKILEQTDMLAEEAVTAATLQEDGTSLATRPTQYQRIIPWAETQGVIIPNWQEGTVAELLERDDLPVNVHAVLKARADTNSAAVKKFYKAVAQADENGLCKNQHDFYGAVTGRWAAKGVQFQNLKNVDKGFKVTDETIAAVKSGSLAAVAKYGDPVSVLGNHVRSMVLAPEGLVFVDADYSSIEARVLAWFARDVDTLQDFQKGVCLYSKLGAKIFNVDLATVDKESQARKVGKAAILGLGFKMGPGTFQAQVKKQAGLELELPFCEDVVRVYREEFDLVTNLWMQLEKSAFMAIRNPGTEVCGWGWSYKMYGDWLTLKLPSGRHLFYYTPFINPEGRWGKPEIQYQGPSGKAYLSVSVLVENLVQATARDLQANALLESHKERIPVVTHVHDSLYALVKEEEAEATAKLLEDVMSRSPTWAEGIPVAVESSISKRVK
jgi:DNA polymerase